MSIISTKDLQPEAKERAKGEYWFINFITPGLQGGVNYNNKAIDRHPIDWLITNRLMNPNFPVILSWAIEITEKQFNALK